MSEFLDDQTKRILRNFSEGDLDNTNRLTMKDLPKIRMAMINVSSHWYNIGIHFGISTGTMDKFRKKNRNDPDNCLTCVIVEWLKNCDERRGPPTWRKVVIAVSSRVGGDHPAEANRIAKEYKQYGVANEFELSNEVDDRPLTSDSLRLVVAYLLEGVANNWFSIGLFLGIPYKFMELFKLEDSLEDSITRMVEAWMARKQDVEAFGEPSWKKLVEAVASRSGGGHRRLASEIAKKHPKLQLGDEVEPIEQQPLVIPTASASPAVPPSAPAPHRPDLLTEADLSALVNVLAEVVHKWEDICLQLGLPMSKLRNIRSSPLLLSGAPASFFREGLYEWLHSARPESPCTISTLCAALREPSVDEGVLASRIETELNNRRRP